MEKRKEERKGFGVIGASVVKHGKKKFRAVVKMVGGREAIFEDRKEFDRFVAVDALLTAALSRQKEVG